MVVRPRIRTYDVALFNPQAILQIPYGYLTTKSYACRYSTVLADCKMMTSEFVGFFKRLCKREFGVVCRVDFDSRGSGGREHLGWRERESEYIGHVCLEF